MVPPPRARRIGCSQPPNWGKEEGGGGKECRKMRLFLCLEALVLNHQQKSGVAWAAAPMGPPGPTPARVPPVPDR